MKLFKPGFVVLLSAILLSYAFKPARANLSTRSFQLSSPTADPFHPNNYVVLTTNPIVDCPGQGKICAIVVPASDVYSSGPNIGKPKVDDFSADGLGTTIDIALNNAVDPTLHNNRVVYERY